MAEMREALAAGADRLLLDNFDIEDLQRAVEINQNEGNQPASLEASGGITIDNIHAIAETGVNYISVGALTKGYQGRRPVDALSLRPDSASGIVGRGLEIVGDGS